MPIQEVIKFLRQSILVQDPEVAPVDPDFLSITEEDFISLLQLCLTKVDPQDDLMCLKQQNLFPLILVAKKELYHRLAVKSAKDYSITSATGVALKRNEVFDHYYKLIEEVETDYKNYLATGMPVQVGEVLLSSRYFSQRNYSLASKPSLIVGLDTIYTNTIEISWMLRKITQFAKYEIYLGTKPIIDKYKKNAISIEALKVDTIRDIHNTCYRIEDLKPNTEYYLLVLVEERNGLQGYQELKFTTLSEGGVV